MTLSLTSFIILFYVFIGKSFRFSKYPFLENTFYPWYPMEKGGRYHRWEIKKLDKI